MNKKIIIPVVLVLLIVVVVVVNTCGGGNKVTLEWSSVSAPLKNAAPIELNVFVENSGSMDGYMCPGSNLKDAVFDYVSDLKKESSSMSLYYINSQIIPCNQSLDNYIRDLTPASFAKAGGNRANTDLRQIINLILQKHKKNTVTVFVSDCILDIPEKALDYFGNCQISIKNSFIAALGRNPELGVQIMKLQSKFNGYWYCGKNMELLTNVKRPYYIWVIGDKHLLAKINKEVPYDKIIGGVDNYCAYSNPDAIPFDIEKKKYVVNHTGIISVEILADLSCSLQSESILTDCNNYSVENPTQVNVVSSERIKTVGSKYSHVLTVKLDNPKSLNSVTVTASFPGIAPWVNRTNDNSGENVKKNLDKTTGILYLIRGVSEAYKSAPYGEISFKIKK